MRFHGTCRGFWCRSLVIPVSSNKWVHEHILAIEVILWPLTNVSNSLTISNNQVYSTNEFDHWPVCGERFRASWTCSKNKRMLMTNVLTFYSATDIGPSPVGTGRRYDVVLMSMRRNDVAPTSVRRHIPAGAFSLFLAGTWSHTDIDETSLHRIDVGSTS